VATGVPARLTPREGRRFGLTVGAAFLVLAALMWWRGRVPGEVAFGILGGLLVLAGLAAPARLGPVYRVWMGLAGLLSKVTTPIFMGVVYFLVLTPVALVLRLLGKHPLGSPGRAESIWVGREPGQRRSDLLRQF
jgi:hypothetical protein